MNQINHSVWKKLCIVGTYNSHCIIFIIYPT